MKLFLLALFVAVASAAPATINNDGVELIVNGVPEGQPLEIGDVVDIKLKEHVDGVLTSKTDLLHPLTAVGLAEAQIAVEAAAQIAEESAVEEVAPTLVEFVDNAEEVFVLPSVVVPEPSVVEPESSLVEPAPSVVEPIEEIPVAPIVLPAPAQPEVVQPIDIIAINPVAVEPVPETVQEPVPQIPTGEIYNDGLVQIQVNAPEETGVFSTIQNWFSLVVNYISNGIQTTQQIV